MKDKSTKQTFKDERKRAVVQAQKAIADISAKGKDQREMISVAKDMALSRLEEQAAQESKHDMDKYSQKSALLDQFTNAAQQGNLEEMKRIRELLNELPE